MPEAGFPRDTAQMLNKEWEVDAAHRRFHKDGNWYHPLEDFPGAYFDPSGYILLSEAYYKDIYEKYKNPSSKSVHIKPHGIASIPGYKPGKWQATPHRLAQIRLERINETEDKEKRAWLRVRENHRAFAIPVKSRGQCALTGLKTAGLLDACHIRPWKDCDNRDRRNPVNGLCLATHIHKAFDLHLLGITSEGDVRYFNHFSSEERRRLGLSDQMRIKLLPGSEEYIKDRFREFLARNEITEDA